MASLWRFTSPTTLLFALILFPLPWVEIQCPSKKPPPAAGSVQAKLPSWVGDLFFQPHDAILTQSGLQAVFRGWSHSDPKFPETPEQTKTARDVNEAMPRAAALILWPALLLAGIGAGSGMRPGRWRRIIVASCAGGALSIALVQRAMGFPLEHAYRSLAIEDALLKARETGVPPSPQAIDAEVKAVTRYTAWFWLAQYAIALTFSVLAAEWWWVCRRPPIELDTSDTEEREPPGVCPPLLTADQKA